MFQFQTKNHKVFSYPKRERTGTGTYLTARWTPVIKDIVEDCIDDKLDENLFPFYFRRKQEKIRNPSNSMSARYNWKSTECPVKNLPKIIVFIVGGITMSEIRCGYQLTSCQKDFEVIMGSTHIITPEKFLKDLENLK